MINAVDLFCGAGGLTSGLASSGVKVCAGVDNDRDCRYAYEYNNGALFVGCDVRRLSSDDVKALFPRRGLRLLAGCAPCQPFSNYTQGRETENDPKWQLLREFSRIVRGVKPELVTMENVATVTRHVVFKDFVTSLEKLGYVVDARVIPCADYGLPQTRERLVLVASRLTPLMLPTPRAKSRTVRDAIFALPPIRHGETHPEDPLHKAASLSAINLKRISASEPGGTWRDWPRTLRAQCHLKTTGHSYSGVYGRMSWDHKSPTVTTQFYNYGSGRFGHPEQDRAISLREAALLQSFPRDYEFVEPGQPATLTKVSRMIGNAVPPLIGRIVGNALMKEFG